MSTSADNEPQSIPPARGFAAVIDFACTTHTRASASLAVFCLIAFLPGFFQIPAVDRDEARFAQASKQMVESGNFVDIRFQDDVRYKKPVGIYWLQSAAVKAGAALGVPDAHTTIWLYRLPSLAGAVSGVLLTYWTALAFVGRRAALLAALMMASSILLGVEARLAKTDAVLLACSVAAIGALARIYLGQRNATGQGSGWLLPGLLWTAIAASVLIKGPLVLMFVTLTALSLSIVDRSARWLLALRPVSGIVWMLLLVLPWFIAIAAHSGDRFFEQSIGHDMLAKVAGGQEAHGAPPGFYFLLFWVMFWPGAVLAGLAAPSAWRRRRDPDVRFLLAWLIPSWLIFEAVITKLPHYVLPLYPAVAILIAGVLERGDEVTARWLIRGTVGWFLLPSVIAISLPVVFVIVGHDLGLISWPFAAAAVIFGLFAWWLYEADGPERALLRGMASSVCIGIAVYAVTFPSLASLFPSAMIADQMKTSGCKDPRLATTTYYQEPSLIFLAGTDTRITDGAGAAEFLNGGGCRFALVDAYSARAFVQRAGALGLRYVLDQRIDGFNISIGRPVVLSMFRSTEPP
jgi:4-amino-4-deoxy-L-arabinose transferase-like glycosyltransferase